MLPENNETQIAPEDDSSQAKDIDSICIAIVEDLAFLVEASLDDRLPLIAAHVSVLENMSIALHLMVARVTLLEQRKRIREVK
jgi:hypothetical protein